MRRINDVRPTLIATQELGRWRMRRQLDTEESGSLSLGFAVGRSLCESASVCLTDAWSILPQICFGHIHRRREGPVEPGRGDTPGRCRHRENGRLGPQHLRLTTSACWVFVRFRLEAGPRDNRR